MSSIRVEIDGLPQLIRGLRNNANLAKPLHQAFFKIGIEQQSDSVRKAPVGISGKLRDSIKYEIDRSPLPTFVRIGTIGGQRVGYAAYMEFGTGLVHDHPSWPRKPHRVPPGVLRLWAVAQMRSRDADPNMTPEGLEYLAGRAIMKRGGLTPRRYLRGPFEANRPRYVRTLQDALRRASLG